jgi:hypothetical protein
MSSWLTGRKLFDAAVEDVFRLDEQREDGDAALR